MIFGLAKTVFGKKSSHEVFGKFFLHTAKGKKIGQGVTFFFGKVFFLQKNYCFSVTQKIIFKRKMSLMPWDASNSCETFHRCPEWKLNPKLTSPRSEAHSPWPLKDDWRWNIRPGGWGLAIANGLLPFAFAGGGELDDRTIWSPSVNREILV